MLRSLGTFMIALGLVHSACGFAYGDENSGGATFGIGPRYTYVMNQDDDEKSHMAGVFARAGFTFLGVEGAIDYHKEDLPLGLELKSWPISATLLVYPMPVFYALAGLAWYNTTLEFPSSTPFESQSESQLGYHVGAGVELPLSPRVSLCSDLRWLFIDYEFDDIAASIGDVEANALTINAGLLIGLN
jgi:opacity protein-like surface antigen